MKSILTPLYISLFLLLVGEWRSSAYNSTDDITLNCGSSGEQPNEYDSRTWSGDINSKLSPKDGQGNTTSQYLTASPSSSSASQVPYTTARLSYSEFTYTFPLSPGQKFIRLYFNPAQYNPDFNSSNSLFSVTAGGFTILKDFNATVTAEVDEVSGTVKREFCVNIEPEQQSLNLTFLPTKDAYAFINGIEIVSMPPNLYYTAEQSQGIKYLGNAVNYRIENSTALEMVYRINIGGSPLSPNEDTGMYRNWEGDDKIYLDDLSNDFSVIRSDTSIQLKFNAIPEYTASVEVYQTARTMGANKTRNRGYNLTWELPVDPNFRYFVRLHFCEFQKQVTETRDRLFFIYIANQTAEEKADVIMWSGGNGIPVFRDYVVDIFGPTNEPKVNLFLVLQANPSGSGTVTQFNDAILNGLEIFKLNNSDGNLAGLNPDLPSSNQPEVKAKSRMHSENKLIIPVLAGVVSTTLVLSLLGFLVFRRGRKVKDSSSSKATKWGPICFATTKSTKSRGSSLPSDLCRHFSLAEIKAATQNFNDVFIIGVGGFGNVYKGYVDDGSTPVAIKRLKPESSQGAHEFKTEIEMLSQLRHRHLVSLIGYCADQGEMILVYDYMSRGTLSDHLHHIEKPHLPWERRLRICIGTAQGLHYLHTGTKGTIIHRDVKSRNILLDEKWVAKVSDFGLSKMGNITMSKTHISTKVKGTFGYLDPDYYRRQQLTEKSDVYSFGVVLCEVLCGRPAVTIVDNIRVGLAGWAKKCHRDGLFDQIVDPNLKGEIAVRCLHKFASIAMSCLDDNGTNRPSMDDVVRGLQFALQMQQNNEGYIDRINERTDQDEISLIKNNEGCCSSEQSSGANESVQELTKTIFSEIIDPVGR